MPVALDPYRPELLPDVIGAYFAGHHETHDYVSAASAFTEDAVVVDDGSTHAGIAEIRDWLQQTSTEFTYTTEHVGQKLIAEGRWLVLNHLEGDFPGGEVDLRFRFVIVGDRIRSLTIAR